MTRALFSHSRAIFVEGVEDAAFLRALSRDRLLQFDISPVQDIGGAPGISGFSRALEYAEVITGFADVTDVVLVADADNHVQNNFNLVLQQVCGHTAGNLDRNWGNPNTVAHKAPGDPSLAIWLWPGSNRRGSLETLLWRVIVDVHPEMAACAQSACDCAGINRANTNLRYKALVRCFLTIAKERPITSLPKIWEEAPELIPLNHSEFNPISRFLASI